MVNRLIEWSARNVFIVLLGTFFIAAWGAYAVFKMPVDAIPDLSDVQVIIYTEYPGQAPQVVEDQVTYALTTAMLAVPRSKVVRGLSVFGASFVYILFEDGTDIYWARSRVLEYLNYVSGRLPRGVTPSLGPDATGVGWVYQYVVVAKNRTLEELRTIQDWFVRFQLTKAHGISEIASVGGFVRQYQVTVNPRLLQTYGVPLMKVMQVIRDSNRDVGGRVVELTETEYMVRGRGYLRGIADLETLVVKAEGGTAVLIRDVARVELVPEERRGITELNGEGEVVAGIAVARYGQNARDVIRNLKEKVAEISSGLPEGVSIKAVYDRSELIHRAIKTLSTGLVEQVVIVAFVCIVFLMHVRSALVTILMLPIAVLVALIVMDLFGMSSNIMSLGGIVIAIGSMVDAAIVMTENAHKHLERLAPGGSRLEAIIAACREVGPSLFSSLLIVAVSLLPVLTLEAQEGRLFKPLAYTQLFAMGGAALLAITLVPVLLVLFLRGRIPREADNRVARFLVWIYRPMIVWVTRHSKLVIVVALVLLGVTAYPALRLGSEFMPELNEGTLLYMPATLPSLSLTKAGEILQMQDRIIKSFPEVQSVFGKAGRANTATDPAPMEMFETVINLKPESEWRPAMTQEKLIAELDAALQFPGIANAWTMPIKARVDMLSTGIRTPIGIKVFGKDLAGIERVAKEVETVMKGVPGTTSAYAERLTGGYYIDIEPDRMALARYGLGVGDLLDVIAIALGGDMVTTTVEGLERYSVVVRYPRDFRSDPEAIARQVLVPVMGFRAGAMDAAPAAMNAAGGPSRNARPLKTLGATMLPLGQLAKVKLVKGPPNIRTENALLAAYIYVDIRGRDIGGYVADAQRAVREKVSFPPGYFITWSGQFEYMERAKAKLQLVVPLTILLIFMLLYLTLRRLTDTLIVMLSVPFALVGSVWLMYALGYNLSVAAAVGFIALLGLAAGTVVVMVTFLDQTWQDMQDARARSDAAGQRLTAADLDNAVVQAAVSRVRALVMTMSADVVGLLPIMWGTGTGSEVMRRVAAPMWGGMVSVMVLTLILVPAIFAVVKKFSIRRSARTNSVDPQPA